MNQENSALSCEFDDEPLVNEEDYKAHLQIVHEMTTTTSMEYLITKAKERNKAKNKIIENSTKSLVDFTNDDDLNENQNKEDDINVNDLKLEKEMREAVDFVFKDMKIMIDGMLPSINEDLLKTDYTLPKDMTKCFDDLRNIITSIEIPSDN